MFLILFILGCVLFYYYNIKKFSYFSKRNIKHDPPIPIFGNILRLAFATVTETELVTNWYNKYDGEKIVGYYRGTKPELIIRDPELLKHIFSSNFLHFYKRGNTRDPKVEPLMLHVLALEGDKWKLIRNGISPAFTGKKIKAMFPILNVCAERLINIAKEIASKGKDFDACNLCDRYSMEATGAIGFGIDMNTINNEYSLFIKLREMIFIKSKWQLLLFAIKDLFPNSFIKKVSLSKPEVRLTLINILKIIREQRKNDINPRDDFINLLLELEKTGTLYGDSLETDENGRSKKIELDFDDAYLIAQLYIFFIAGFETSSSTMSYTMHELAYHPEIQKEIQEEIDKVLLDYNNKLCYEAVSEMSLLEMAVKEALRLFPPGGVTVRECTKDFIVPDSNITIESGMKLIIPIAALHNDPKYFENPDQFQPKRFSTEATKSWPKYAYIPFGEGPRKCIGTRLGMIGVMSGLAAILEKFNIEPSPSSTRNFKLNCTTIVANIIEGGLPLRLTLRKNTNSKKY